MELKNTGEVKGREVVQLYVGDKVRIPSPNTHELKGFASVSLDPGASQTVTFSLTQDDLSYYDQHGNLRSAEGTHTLWVTSSSDVSDTKPVDFDVAVINH